MGHDDRGGFGEDGRAMDSEGTSPSGPGPEASAAPGRSLPSSGLGPLAGAELDELLRELLQRVDEVMDTQHRLRLLLDASIAIAADLDVERVLESTVRVACDLAGARYGALAVLGTGSGDRLSSFVTHGLSEDEQARIGPLPTGRGVLGLLIAQPEPLRLHRLSEHEHAVGVPPEHPPMQSFLGVPVRVRDKVFGNLYLTEKLGGGDFTELDESVVVALAAAAGVVIENARLYEEGARREQWLAASAEITPLLLGEVDPDQALQAVAERARDIARADFTTVVLRRAEDELEVRVTAGNAPAARDLPHLHVSDTLSGVVVSTGETVVLENFLDDPRSSPERLADQGWPAVGPVVLVPMRTTAGVEGVLTMAWLPEHRDAFDQLDVVLPQRYAEQAALALQVGRARQDRERLTVFEDRDRIGRDLHDLVIQRLFAIGLSLENTSRMIDSPELTARVTGAVDDIDSTIKDIRRTIFALSASPESVDVRTALSAVVDRAARSLKLKPHLQFQGPVSSLVDQDTAVQLVAVLHEALTNVARHAGARDVEVLLSVDEDVVLTVRDDGRGMPEGAVLSGLANLRERATEQGGSCVIDSAPGQGTVLRWCIPRV